MFVTTFSFLFLYLSWHTVFGLAQQPTTPQPPSQAIPNGTLPIEEIGETFSGQFMNEMIQITWQIIVPVETSDIPPFIDFNVSAPTTGWVAIGFQTVAFSHTNSDMYLVAVLDDGTTAFIDGSSDSRSAPQADTEENIVVLFATETGGTTSFGIRRLLDTGDADQDQLIEQGAELFLDWAWNDNDSFTNQHNQRNLLMIDLFTGQVTELSVDLEASEWITIASFGFIAVYGCIRWSYLGAKWMWRNIAREGQEDEVELPSLRSPEQQSRMKSPRTNSRKSPNTASRKSPNTASRKSPNTASRKTSPLTASRKGKHDNNSEMSSPATSPRVESRGASPPSSPSTLPRLNQYYKGSELYPETEKEEPRDDSRPQSPQLTARHSQIIKYNSKSGRNVIHDWSRAFSHGRIPGTQYKLTEVFLFFLFVVAEFLIVYLDDDNENRRAIAWGYISVANSMFVLLAATKHSIFHVLIGTSFEKVIQWHRWIGNWTTITVLIHFISFFFEWDDNGQDIGEELGRTKSILGIIGFACSLFLYLESFKFIRRKFFEIFYYLHFFFLAYVIMAMVHSSEAVPYIAAGLSVYFIDLIFRIVWSLWPRKTLNIQLKPGGVVSMELPKHPLSRYQLGQYIFLNFPGVSLHEWHPYTLSSGPYEDNLEVHIRSLGDYTNSLAKYIEDHQGENLWFRMAGPHGRLSLNYRKYPNVILIAGGIGITPLIAILKTIYRIGVSIDEQKKHPLSPFIQQVFLIWAVPDRATYEWFEKVIQKAIKRSDKENSSFPKLHPFIHFTREDTVPEPSEPYFELDRPDISDFFESLDLEDDRAAVYACGPKAMINDTWDATSSANLRGHSFDFHHETFNW